MTSGKTRDNTALVATAVAAREVGVDRTTLARWVASGLITPASRTIGGHMRWNLDQLREQLAAHGATAPE